MGSLALSLSTEKRDEYGYELAYRLACKQLAKIEDVEQQCLRSEASCQVVGNKTIIKLDYLNRSYQIILPEIDVSFKDSEEEVRLRDKILILHYFAQAKGTLLSNRQITYKEVPGGTGYFPTFHKRAIKPLSDYFGQEPERLVDVAGKLGGYKADYGDVSVTINAFSRVPVTLVLWRGDEEFAPEGNIIFDALNSS